MLNKLKAKLKKQGGFTLIEMLIVVAIIAILIAISIPLVNGALEKARDSTDQANERAAKAEALLYFMGTVSQTELGEVTGDAANPYVPGTKLEAYYDAQEGKLVKYDTSAKPATYGQCTSQTDCYQASRDDKATHVNKVIKVVVETTGEVKITWE